MNRTVPPSALALGLGTVTVARRATVSPGLDVVGVALTVTAVGARATQAVTRLYASMDPRPEAQSYPSAAA